MADFLGMLRFIIWIDLSTDFSSYQIILKLSQLVTIMLSIILLNAVVPLKIFFWLC
jgi:hypothetical protein